MISGFNQKVGALPQDGSDLPLLDERAVYGAEQVRQLIREDRTRYESRPVAIDVDSLAQEIRRLDGNHVLGAGALAEKLLPFIERYGVSPSARAAAVARIHVCEGEISLSATSEQRASLLTMDGAAVFVLAQTNAVGNVGRVVGWQFYQGGCWHPGSDTAKDHRQNTEAAGIPTRDVFAFTSGLDEDHAG